jgi:hypothetical protein
MAKRDEATGSEMSAASVGTRARVDGSVASEIVTSVVEMNEAILSTTIRTIGAVSAMRSRVTGRAIDFAESSVQDVLRIVRDANQAEADLESQALQAVERIVSGSVRRIGGAVLAITSAADPRTTMLGRAQA